TYAIEILQCYVAAVTVTCDFELDECAWTRDKKWLLAESGTGSPSSGPLFDHTTGSGHYALFSGSATTATDPSGHMNTSFTLNESQMLSFWYYMNGNQIGTLALILNGHIMWSKTGRQSSQWLNANITLPTRELLNIEFVANRSDLGKSSDIAIDDIVLHGEAIPSTRTPRTRPTTTPRARSNASCDFDYDRGTCGWRIESNNEWKVVEGKGVDVQIGPGSDYSSIMRKTLDDKNCEMPYTEGHTRYYCMIRSNVLQCKTNNNKDWTKCSKGYYIQIESGNLTSPGASAQFTSPTLDAVTQSACVMFQYNIAGTDDDILNVYIRDFWSDRDTHVWSRHGTSNPDRWNSGEAPLEIDMSSTNTKYQAMKGKLSGTGVVSVDQIVITGSPCELFSCKMFLRARNPCFDCR
ncbi:unnamed protein product, partial [Didymodactylos carnosus]